MKENNLISTHVNGYFAGNYSSIEAVPAKKTVCEVFYDGTFHVAFYNGTEWIEKATAQEIAEANKPKVPQTISAMRLKLQLFDMGITDQDIFDDIDSIPDFMFSFAEKEKAKIMYKTAVTFERTNGELNFVATMEGLTQEQVDEIFINGNLLR